MAIKTTPFSGWHLSGEEAATFIKQAEDVTPNPSAKLAIENGQALAKEYIQKGYVTLSPTIKKNAQRV